jgi:hypothetical protein
MITIKAVRRKSTCIGATSAVVGWLCALVVGCGVLPFGDSFVRLDADGVRESFGASRPGEWSATVVTLSSAGRIRKVVIVPKTTLTRLEVQVRARNGEWESVRHLAGRFASNITVRMDAVGDAVRVIEKVPSVHRERGAYVAGTDSSIETVLVFGTRLPDAL